MDGSRREAFEGAALSILGITGSLAFGALVRPDPPQTPPLPTIDLPAGAQPPAHAEEVASYVLRARLDPSAHRIEGQETITFHNVSRAPLATVRLHLYLNAFREGSVFRAARIERFRGSKEGAAGRMDVHSLSYGGVDVWPRHRFEPPEQLPQLPAGSYEEDHTDVIVPLPEPIEPGATATFELSFDAQLPELSARTGWVGSFHFLGQWFPKLALLRPSGEWAGFPFHHLGEFAADFGSYDVTLDVPSAFVVGATGVPLETRAEGGRTLHRFRADDVHDFAAAAWDKFVAHEGRVELPSHAVDVRVLTPPGFETAAERELAAVADGLRHLSARFGEYPHPRLTVVHPPLDASEAGGMEYPTLITTGGGWWSPWGVHDLEAVTLHELGHQWFQGLVATHEVDWPAGDEGLNSHADDLSLTRRYGAGGVVGSPLLRLSYEAVARRAADPVFEEPIFQPAWAFATGRSYGRVYTGTALVMRTLRASCGPERFDAALGRYARRYRFGHPTADDLFAVFEEVLGPECARAARVAATQPGTFDVSVASISSRKVPRPRSGDEPRALDVAAPGAADDRWFANAAWLARSGLPIDLPIDVELRFSGGERVRRTVRFGERTWLRLDEDGPARLQAVVIDPERKLAIDRHRANDFASQDVRGGVPYTRERTWYWGEVLAGALGP